MTTLRPIRGGRPKRVPVRMEMVECRDLEGGLLFIGRRGAISRTFLETITHYPSHVLDRAINVMRFRGEIPTTAEMIRWMTHDERMVEAKRRGLRSVGGNGSGTRTICAPSRTAVQ